MSSRAHRRKCNADLQRIIKNITAINLTSINTQEYMNFINLHLKKSIDISESDFDHFKILFSKNCTI